MSEIVECFVVGHWALSHKKLTERHVSQHMANLVDVEMEPDGFPQELYECFIQTFSKEGDLVLDIGSENGKFFTQMLLDVTVFLYTFNSHVQQYKLYYMLMVQCVWESLGALLFSI